MSRFHATVEAHERGAEQHAEDELQLEQQYAAAQEGLYDRDREARDTLDGLRPNGAAPEPDSAPPGLDELAGQASATADASAAEEAAATAAAAAAEPRLDRASPGSGAGRGLSRASALSTTTASSDDTEHAVQVVQAEDGGPLRRFVTRSSSFTKEDFDKLLQHTGMFNVQPAGSTDKRLLRSHLPPSKVDSLVSAHGMLAQRRRRRRQKDGHRSIFGLRMWRPDSSKYVAWSVVVLLSDLTYSAFIVPISIGMWTSFYEANWTSICDFGFGGIFLLDMLIALHVGFIATCGTRKLLVMNGRLVAQQYLTSFAFFVDACACVAWMMQIGLIIASTNIASFNPNTALVVMEGIRLLRFLRVYRLVMSLLRNGVYATLVIESPYFKWLRSQTLLSLMYMMYMIAVVINFLGCLYNFTAGAENWENTWVNYYAPFVRRYGDGSSALTSEEASDINRVWLYFTGVYWALSTVATVGFGDIVPQSAVEVLVVIFVEICGVLFFGLLISSISELLAHANRNARRVQAFRNKMQSVERWMQQNMLPRKLQRRIKTFYAEVWVRQHEVKEETVLFQELPHALRNEVAWQACRSVFGKVTLLRELDDKTLYLLASKMTPFRFGPGHDLVTEGDPADRFWILVEGEVIALYHYHEAERLEGPAVIGQSVLLQEHEEALRTFPCTYRTLTSCTVWMVRCRDFKPMLTSRPGLHDLVKARALQSLTEQIQRFPSMWRGRGLKRFDTAVVHRLSDLRRASSDFAPHEAHLEGAGHDYSAAPPHRAGAGGSDATAVLRRLASVSAPAASAAKHYKSVSWGGGRTWGRGNSGPSTGSSSDNGATAGGASGRSLTAATPAGMAAAAGAWDTRGMESQSSDHPRQGMHWEAAAAAALAEVEATASGEQREAGLGPTPVSAGSALDRAARGGSPPGSSRRSPVPPPLPTVVEHAPLGHPGNAAAGNGVGSGPDALPATMAVAAAEMSAARAAGTATAAARALAGGPPPSVTNQSLGATAVVEAEAAAGRGSAEAQATGQPQAGAEEEEEEMAEPLQHVLVVQEAPLGATPTLVYPTATSSLSPSEAGSQSGAERSRPGMVAAGAAALASRAFATAGGIASVLPGTRLAVAARRERRAASRQDAEYEAEMRRISAVMAEPDSPGAPARDRSAVLHDGRIGTTDSCLPPDQGHGAEEADALRLPVQRLTTEQALAMLQHASLARQDEEAAAEAAAEAMSAAAAAMAAGAGTPCVGGGTSGGADVSGNAGMQAQQPGSLLAALLAEVQSLRKQVDRLQPHRPGS
ncbi:hypothetical protein ABPG77_007923 [Micractinium sp. CCAP 211/92]